MVWGVGFMEVTLHLSSGLFGYSAIPQIAEYFRLLVLIFTRRILGSIIKSTPHIRHFNRASKDVLLAVRKRFLRNPWKTGPHI